jgi:hypothetical protein
VWHQSYFGEATSSESYNCKKLLEGVVALVAAMWFGSARAMERRGESGGGVQVRFKPMMPHSFSSALTGSVDFGGCYPLLSPTSFD